MIERQHVLDIARLAGLRLTDEEVGRFTRELGKMLDFFAQLDTAPTDGIDPETMWESETSPLRDDQPLDSLDRETILQNGPAVTDYFFAVPRVIDAPEHGLPPPIDPQSEKG